MAGDSTRVERAAVQPETHAHPYAAHVPASTRATPLTREEIIAAAVRLTEREGLQGVTMRSLAAELDVTPMAVYYYVKSKDEVVRLVVSEVLSEAQPLHLDTDGWQASLRRHLGSILEIYGRYPGITQHMIEQPTFGATASVMDRGREFFEMAGFDERSAALAWSFALTYVHGRLSVQARMGRTRRRSARRVTPLRAADYVDFGVDAVIAGIEGVVAARG